MNEDYRFDHISPAVVNGRKMDMSIQEFVRRCEILISAELTKVSPDNVLIDILANSVRLAREFHDMFSFH